MRAEKISASYRPGLPTVLTMNIEVFKTNVTDQDHANMLIARIHRSYMEYTANFDLSDCDNILRVKSASGSVEPDLLIKLLRDHGFFAEILPDEAQHSMQSFTNQMTGLSSR
jgi:hypothetical protein